MSDPAGPPRSRGTSQGRSIWFAAARAKRAERLRRSDGDFDQWVEAVTERADPLMAWLGIVFALVVGFEIAADPSRRTAQLLEWTGWTICAVFLLEFLAKLWLAPRRLRFMRKHWLQAAALVVPTLRVLRFVPCCDSGGLCLRHASSPPPTALSALRNASSALASPT